MRQMFLALALGAGIGLAAGFAAQAQTMTPEMQARVQAAMEETYARLNLSPEQKTAITPILQDAMQKRLAMLEEFRAGREPGQKPSRSEMMAMRDKSQAMRAGTRAALAPHLTPEQLAEWDQIQEERRAKMREAIMNGGAPQL
ncbi:MAG: hypothetical protein HXY22_12325 [Alphaproteobacteria bacterium]|nr:hypothetical protein [Alphaproteobacteria bacterium]